MIAPIKPPMSGRLLAHLEVYVYNLFHFLTPPYILQCSLFPSLPHPIRGSAVCSPLYPTPSGVGQNLQDHLEVYIQQECTKPITLYKWQQPHNMVRIGAQWFLTRTGM